MLDTKLKKSHKKTNLIIALIVLIPALILVCLYPTMEKAMLRKREFYIAQWEQMKAEMEQEKTTDVADENTPVEFPMDQEYILQDNFTNYVVETTYYQYAMFLEEAYGREADLSVLEYFGWINDYYKLISKTPYYIEYLGEDMAEETSESGKTETDEPQMMFKQSGNFNIPMEDIDRIFLGQELEEETMLALEEDGYLGYLYIEYNEYGRVVDIRICAEEDRLLYDGAVYQRVKDSQSQYLDNVEYSPIELQDPMEICPKNFRGIYLIYEENDDFVGSYEDYDGDMIYNDYYDGEPYYSPLSLYLDTGAFWLVAVFAVLVFLAAMILPFIKRLETGWEKLFCIPTELMLCLAVGVCFLAVGMCALMGYTTMDYLNELFQEQGYKPEFLGYAFSTQQCYGMMLVVNFLGWAVVFFCEYICVAQIRQFFCSPGNYFKDRFLGIRFCRWVGRKCKALGNYILKIDIGEKLHQSILKIVIANGLIVILLCCMWFGGVVGAVIYTVLLYILLKKYGEKLQKQYRSILNATGQMADGNLAITLEEDLGLFEPLGEELCKVQKGFSKAVAEEAKSQNMKSELITNVSHDLKTPLTAIITYVDLLKKPDITEEERASYIETLDLKSQRLKVLIEDLFEVSKANSGNVTMNFMEVDIVKLMKELRLEMADKIEESTLDFRFQIPEEKVLLWLDGQRTYRILENLLNNAIKYAMPYTRVYVDIIDQETEVDIIFKNMSAQELNQEPEHLTERFVRGDSSRNSEGSGLGLAIARSFTELQNGEFKISVDGDLFKVSVRFLKKTEEI